MLLSSGAFEPSTYGNQQPAFGGDQYFYPQAGLALSNAFQSYGQVYRSQIWIAALVNKIAASTARLPLKVYERAADGSRAESRDLPLAKLLRNPNPRHGSFFFWLWTVSTFEIYGEALWIKVRPRPGAAPTQLWPMHPANVTTRRNEDGDLVYRYEYGSTGGKFLEWLSGDVVHFRSYNPDDLVRGMSRLEPLRQTILNEDASRRASASIWKNGGRPSMVVAHPKTMSEPALQRLSSQLNALHAGPDNWGKIAILEEGMQPQFPPVSAEAMEYVASRQMNREEACGIYDVPPPVVHILDRATFSNITEQMRSMYRDTMAPRLGLYESALDTQLRPDFDPAGRSYAEFLLDEVLRGDFEQRAASNQAAIFSGQRTPNEVRRQDNLPPVDGGDQVYLSSALIPLSSVGAPPATEPTTVPAVEGNSLTACAMCGTHSKTSPRGLCRGCEGKVGRMLGAGRKELA